MNEVLKFSWGHIIAFIALIAVGYVAFVSLAYLYGGDFTIASIGTSAIVLLYIIFFIGAQRMKACEDHFRRNIVFERIFLFGSVPVFLAGIVVVNQFFTVRSRDAELVDSFRKSITNANGIFDDYESYANTRVESYSRSLDNVIRNRQVQPSVYAAAGFTPANESYHKENLVKLLRLQLLSDNYTRLRESSRQWIASSSEGASTWNVFLIGNTAQIKDAITSWEGRLKEFSMRRVGNEVQIHKVEDFKSTRGANAHAGLDALTRAFSERQAPGVFLIVFGVVIYLMLLTPYLLQERNSKSVYRLLGRAGSISSSREEGVKAGADSFDKFGEAPAPADDKDDRMTKRVRERNREKTTVYADDDDILTF